MNVISYWSRRNVITTLMVLLFSIVGLLSLIVGVIASVPIPVLLYKAFDFPLGTFISISRLLIVVALFAGAIGLGALVLPAIKALIQSAAEYNMSSGKQLKFTVVCAITFITFMILSQILSFMTENHARRNIKEYLNKAPLGSVVTVGGSPVDDADLIIAELKETRRLPAHHSHPTKNIKVTIESGETVLVLFIARDSNRYQEYWIFYPYYSMTKYIPPIHIGGIVTDAFDKH